MYGSCPFQVQTTKTLYIWVLFLMIIGLRPFLIQGTDPSCFCSSMVWRLDFYILGEYCYWTTWKMVLWVLMSFNLILLVYCFLDILILSHFCFPWLIMITGWIWGLKIYIFYTTKLFCLAIVISIAWNVREDAWRWRFWMP